MTTPSADATAPDTTPDTTPDTVPSTARAETSIVVGLLVASVAGLLAMGLNLLVPPVSALLIAIVGGAVFANTIGVRDVFRPGFAVAARRVLRIGVALLGFQLVVGQVLGLGWPVLAGVVVIVAGGIVATVGIGALLGVSPARRLLIACGFSICGASAVAAADGVTESDEEDVAVALALVVAFGSLAMLVLPAIATQLGFEGRAAGAWMGGGIHEVGQVVVAGGILGAAALQVAVIVKLARVLMLAPVLTVLSWQHRRTAAPTAGKRPPLVPAFVLAFIALVVIGSVVPVDEGLRDGVRWVQVFALSTAMFALGCGVDVRSMRRLRPAEVLLGVASSACVALLALPLVFLVS